nr:hypothetical protein [Tanacetum cinerariifolium]
MNLLNGICNHCIYGDGKQITCNGCEGMLRGGFCLPCKLKAENSIICYQNAYSFDDTSNNSNYLPQPQYENYLCNLCGNNSHDGYDFQQQFPLVHEQEPSYNQNCNDNYYPHDSPSFPCCGNCRELMKLSSVNQWTKILFFPEYSENSSNETSASNSNQEKEGPPQNSDIRQLIKEECCIEVCEEQKQNMENTILELVEICRQKELLCMHDNVDDLIESALNSKLLSINSQRLNKEKQEVKNVVKQTAERRNLHAIASILSTKLPDYSPSMAYEYPNTTPETKSDEIIKSGVEELVPIPSECEVTSEDESKCDMPIQDQSSSVFMTFTYPLFKDNDDLTSSDDESLSEEDVPIKESKVYSNPLFDDDEINSDELESHVESNFVESLSNHDALIDSSQKIDYLEEFSDDLAHINPEITKSDFDFEEEICLIENLMYDNSSPRPPEELNAEIANTTVESIPSSLIPVQDNESQREEIDIVTNTDEVLPPGFENDDSKGEIDTVEELHVDNSISNAKNELSVNEASDFDNPSVPRPPPKPPNAEFDSGEEISVVMNDSYELECLNPRDEFDVSNHEDVDYFPFMFVIRIFMPYLICSKMFSFLLFAESEDTIFDPGISI